MTCSGHNLQLPNSIVAQRRKFKDVFGKALTGNNIFSLRNTRTLEDPTRMIEE